MIGLGQAHPGQQGADAQLPGATPIGSMASIRGATPETSMTASSAASGIMAAGPPRQPDCGGFGGGFQPGDQVAEPLGAADPGRCHERGQAKQLRAVPQPGRAQPGGVQPRQPAPAVQRPDQRIGQVPAARVGAAADQGVPGGPGRGQQRRVVAGQYRHGPRAAAAADRDHDPAGPARHVAAAHLAQVTADRPSAGAQGDQPGRPHPPFRGRLGVREREEPADLRRAVRRLRPVPGQRQISRIQPRHHPAADKPQVRPQCPPRHAGQARCAPGEPLGHRRMQYYLRDRVQAQPDRVIGELARRPQQVLRPLPALRARLGDHVPGERRRPRRHRRRPPPPI